MKHFPEPHSNTFTDNIEHHERVQKSEDISERHVIKKKASQEKVNVEGKGKHIFEYVFLK